jgi:hypothetical protein
LTTYHCNGNEVRYQKVIHWAKQRNSQRTRSMDQFEHFESWNYRLLIKGERKEKNNSFCQKFQSPSYVHFNISVR